MLRNKSKGQQKPDEKAEGKFHIIVESNLEDFEEQIYKLKKNKGIRHSEDGRLYEVPRIRRQKTEKEWIKKIHLENLEKKNVTEYRKKK